MAKLDQQRASSIEASPAELLTLVEQYPDEVMSNPVLLTFSLSHPQEFMQIHILASVARKRRTLREQYSLLAEEKKRRFLLVCAERVAPIVDVVFPTNFVQEALQSVRLVLAGLAPQETLATLNVQAKELFEKASQKQEAKIYEESTDREMNQLEAAKDTALALTELTSPHLINSAANEEAIGAEIWHEYASSETRNSNPAFTFGDRVVAGDRALLQELLHWQLKRLNEIIAL